MSGMSSNEGWILGSGLLVAASVAALPSCGSSQGQSMFGPDAGTHDATMPESGHGDESGQGSDVHFSFDTGPVVRDDFANPIYDTGAPPTSGTIFGHPDVDGGADSGGDLGPCLFEPEIGSLFPNNWLRPRFRWNAPATQNLFEIELMVPNEKDPLIIYTPTSGYTLTATDWSLITMYGVGTIHVTIRSAVVSGSTLVSGPFLGSEGDIVVAPVQATGSVVYWTTSSGTVLKGFKIGDESVQDVITPAQVGEACVACHTSTPDGLDVALTVAPGSDGSNPASLDVRSVDGKATRPSYVTANAIALMSRTNQHAPTFSLGHWSASDRTMLSMFYDTTGTDQIMWTDLAATTQTEGVSWGYLARTGDSQAANSAAWSHDGTKVAYTSTASSGAGVIGTDGQLWTVPYSSRMGGTATPVTGANDPTYNQFYPIFSADDAYLAFDRVPTGSTSYNDAASEIFIIPSAGGTATRLAANDPPACLGVTSPGVTNSWPKSSPQVATANGSQYYFLVFSSTRDQIAMGPQLYVTSFVVTGSTVTTYKALYLWNQPETEHNHTPAWDVFALPPPPPPP
jgi:hypothetical protein